MILRELSIRTKLSLAFALALALMVIVGAASIFQLDSSKQLASSLKQDWLPEMQSLGIMKSAMGQYRAMAFRYFSEPAARQEVQRILDDALSTIAAQDRAYRAVASRPEELSHYQTLMAGWETFVGEIKDAHRAAGSRPPPEEQAALNVKANPLFDQVMAELDDQFAITHGEAIAAAGTAYDLFATYLPLIIVAVTISAAFFGALTVWVTRSVTEPILRVSDAMRRLSKGDTAVVVDDPTRRTDEVGTLIEAVRSYRDSLVRTRALAGQAVTDHERLDAVFNNVPVGLAMFDADDRLVTCNPQYLKMLGLAPELARPGTPLSAVLAERINQSALAGDQGGKYVSLIAEVCKRRQPFKDVFRFAGGQMISVTYQPMANGAWVTMYEDVTNRLKAEAAIAHLTYHDPLTDLPNRLLFQQRVSDAVARQRGIGATAVLSIELDHFRRVVDTLGHAPANRVLCEAGRRVADCIGKDDTVAALGGNEFAVVQVAGAQPAAARALAERITAAVSAPYLIDGVPVNVGVSVGVALEPFDGPDADGLIKSSSQALSRTKSEGHGGYRFFEPEMDRMMQAQRATEVDLRAALSQGQFELWHQPQVNLKTDRVGGFEALIRWSHPTRGIVGPTEFIGPAEDAGLIVDIGEWVLKTACREAASWGNDVRVAVNLSAEQFRGNRLYGAVVAALEAAHLPARRLELEITESLLLADTEQTLATLHRLRALGVRIVMDDFGTGYSSLSYLQSFPFDKIKIDRRFINGLDDGNTRAIVRAVSNLGRSLGMETTAEGVETAEQLERVRSKGCSEVQGFFTGRPMPAAKVPARLAPNGTTIRPLPAAA